MRVVIAVSSFQVVEGFFIFILLCWLWFCVVITIGANRAQHKKKEQMAWDSLLVSAQSQDQSGVMGPVVVSMSTTEQE
jgi:hypothetical protein